ncbi:MAG: YgjV family protein [Ruminococcaceae bacterium]|nr:YgjV family protein [Oscillospiraceae bacterium]
MFLDFIIQWFVSNPQNAIAQCVGVVALCFIVFSYQQKTKTSLILCQLVGAALFGVHYFLLGAYAGFLLNCIAVTRALVFCRENLSRKAGNIWVIVLNCLFALSYALTFLIFNVAPTLPNLIMQALPVIGMCFSTVSFNMSNAGQIRALSIVTSGGWLAYNIYYFSIGGTLCETMSLVSIFIGILRYDIKKKTK